MLMSTLGSALRALRTLLFPSSCMICGEHIGSKMHGICIRCRYEIPLTSYWRSEENPVKEHFAGLVPLVQGSSFIFYSGESLWRDMVHRFKYGGEWAIAESMGRWYGAELRDSGLYDDIDIVVPIPLHPLKTLRRGYNQSRYLAEGIAHELGAKVVADAVVRRRNNPSQARRRGSERWDNVEALFELRKADKLRGKHLLLVDDVLTSGATLTACAEAILKVQPDCRISIATLAVTQRILRE